MNCINKLLVLAHLLKIKKFILVLILLSYLQSFLDVLRILFLLKVYIYSENSINSIEIAKKISKEALNIVNICRPYLSSNDKFLVKVNELK